MMGGLSFTMTMDRADRCAKYHKYQAALRLSEQPALTWMLIDQIYEQVQVLLDSDPGFICQAV